MRILTIVILSVLFITPAHAGDDWNEAWEWIYVGQDTDWNE
ncbi:MAG: hypothetical protein V6Z81_07590 [Parvularculales bacterium]